MVLKNARKLKNSKFQAIGISPYSIGERNLSAGKKGVQEEEG